jgi:hypothetical protein
MLREADQSGGGGEINAEVRMHGCFSQSRGSPMIFMVRMMPGN